MKKLLLFLILTGIFTIYSCSTKDMALDRTNLDSSVNPGNDFYQYANGGWMKNNPLPGEFSRYGSFDKLAEDNQKMVKQLIEDASAVPAEEGSLSQKIGDFYSSGMDTAKIEKLGLDPLKEDFSMIEQVEKPEDIGNLIINLHKRNGSVLFHFFGSPDKKNSEMVIANLYQGGLGLTDVDYYTANDEKSREIREKYKEYISNMLVLTGESKEKRKNMLLKF